MPRIGVLEQRSSGFSGGSAADGMVPSAEGDMRMGETMHHHHPKQQPDMAPVVHVVRGDGRPWITPREAEVLVLVALGLSAREIGTQLVMAPRTVDQHIVNLKMKTGARNRAHMVTIAMCAGLLEPGPAVAAV